MHLMNSASLMFIVGALRYLPRVSTGAIDRCSGRWQMNDKSNIKMTLDWQVNPLTDELVTEFRTNLVVKGSWHAFGLSFSTNEPVAGLFYALRWQETDQSIFWNVLHVNESTVTMANQTDVSTVQFQRLFSSGLLTVRQSLPMNDSSLAVLDQPCLYFVYLRGRFNGSQPSMPDETHFKQPSCFPCRSKWTSTDASTPMEPTTMLSITNFTSVILESLNRHTSLSTSTVTMDRRNEVKLFWLGRLLRQPWLDDYSNLSSFASQKLRLNLQNLFLSLIHSNSSPSLICHQFDLYSLQSGSVLFAVQILLVSDRSEEQTIGKIETLIASIKNSRDFQLDFDPRAHLIKRFAEESQITVLLKNLSRTISDDLSQQAETHVDLRLLIGCVASLASFMILIISCLCLYGYYKCQRRRFRLFTEEQALKFKQDRNAYTWLAPQTSFTCSTPYLIQSTSI